MDKKEIGKEAFELCKILSLATNALIHSQVLLKSKNVHGGTKDWIRRVFINPLTVMRNNVLLALPESDAQILKDDIMGDESALQFVEVSNQFMALPKEDRDKVESFINSLKVQK